MSETIPEARELAETIIDAVEGCGCDDCLEKATKLATLALLARDERAAKIAEQHGETVSNDPIGKACSRNIASAIRDRSRT